MSSTDSFPLTDNVLSEDIVKHENSADVACAGSPPHSFSGFLDFDGKDIGRFISGLNKHVRGKTARQVFQGYSQKFVDASEEERSNMVCPKDIGHITVRVHVEQCPSRKVSYCAWLSNEKVELSEFQEILKKNITTHAFQFSRPTPVEDRFTHKFAWTAGLSHEGLIGKFVGSGAKNVKQLSSDISAALNVPSCYVSINPANDERTGKKPYKNRFVSVDAAIPTVIRGDFEVIITISVNSRGPEKQDIEQLVGLLTRILVSKLNTLGERKVHRDEPEVVDVSTYLTWGVEPTEGGGYRNISEYLETSAIGWGEELPDSPKIGDASSVDSESESKNRPTRVPEWAKRK